MGAGFPHVGWEIIGKPEQKAAVVFVANGETQKHWYEFMLGLVQGLKVTWRIFPGARRYSWVTGQESTRLLQSAEGKPRHPNGKDCTWPDVGS